MANNHYLYKSVGHWKNAKYCDGEKQLPEVKMVKLEEISL